MKKQTNKLKKKEKQKRETNKQMNTQITKTLNLVSFEWQCYVV